MRPIEERKAQFKIDIWESIGKTFDKYDKELCIEFFEVWTEHNEPVRSNTLMRFEKERKRKAFQINRRLATFKKNKETNFGRFKATKDMDGIKFPNYLNKSLLNRLTGDKWLEYKKHLESIGYKYQPSLHGQQSYFVNPKNERIWI